MGYQLLHSNLHCVCGCPHFNLFIFLILLPPSPSLSLNGPVLVRYVRADGKIHTVNLQNPALAEGRTQSVILRVGGLRRSHLFLELYVNCRLADSAQGLPQLAGLPEEVESMEFRHGQKLYTRLQVIFMTILCD